MFGTMRTAVIAGSVMVAGLGFGAANAAADSFSVSVHTPGVSVGYNNYHGHDRGYVSVHQPVPRYYAPAPVYYPPAPVVVYRPQPVHVCAYDSRPITRFRYDDCGRRVYYTDYVRYRTCDDYHRGHYRHDGHRYNDYRHNDHRYNDWDRDHRGHDDKHGDKHGRGHDRDHDKHGHGRH